MPGTLSGTESESPPHSEVSPVDSTAPQQSTVEEPVVSGQSPLEKGP